MLDNREAPKPPAGAGGVEMGRGGFLQGLIGIAVGAGLGYFAFLAAYERAWVVFPVPGFLIGVFCALFCQKRSWLLASIAGLTALVLTFYLHNRVFVAGIGSMTLREWAGVICGAGVAFWFSRGKPVK